MESLYVNPSSFRKKGIAERAVRRMKEGTSAVLLQSGLDENCWADSMECYCYMRHIQHRLSDGKAPFERRFGEPFKDRFFHLVHRLNIILYPRQTSDESINLVRKYYLEYSSAMYCKRRESGKESYWLWTLRSRKRWTRQKSMLNTQRKRGDIALKK